MTRQQHPLTRRELQVLELAAAGATNDEAGERLGIACETVKTYSKHVIAKLGARNGKHAIAIAFRQGILR